MGCCRGKRRALTETYGSAPCKSIEQGGAGLKLLVATNGGIPLLLVRGSSPGDKYDIISYVSMHKCTGPTARNILLHSGRIIQAMRTDIAPFRKYVNGASIVTLLKTADAVLKDTRSRRNDRPNPFPTSI